MNTQKIFKTIKELGHVNSKREELREYCKQKIDQILKFLPRRILDGDGGDLLSCLLSGLSDNSTSTCKSKVKIIDIVLGVMRKESTSLTHCGDVISRLCLELPRLPVDDLVRWCNDSVQSIVDDSDVNMIWRDVLPECLTAISSYNNIKHCGTEMSSTEYKEQCVRTLCQCRWTEKQLVQLAAMFKDMQLSRDDHKQVVNKICSYVIDIPPETLPPLLHQLLKLCKSYNVEVVLAHLSHYFSVRLYSKLEPPPQDSESTTMDVDDIVEHCPVEISRCLSTSIYHISQGATEPELVRKHIKTWPKSQLLRAPFLLDLALAVSDKGSEYRTVCLDVIKSAIEQRLLDEQRSKESAWARSVLPPDVDVASVLKVIKSAIEQRLLDEQRSKESAWARSVLPPDVDVASVLKVLTTESANHRQLTVMGLINLAFSLLSMSKLKSVAPECWSHGKLILVRLSKTQPETTGYILSQLADRLAGDAAQRQYADCLYILCKLTGTSVERCSQLSMILENCKPSPTEYRPAAAVLDAVHPLLSFSTRTRDTLVMVCRKGLHSRDSVHRCLALSGFLTLLRHVQMLRRVFSSSQSSSGQYSEHSYLTQLTVDLHATQQGAAVTSRVRNEEMCMEVVSILRRCLVQDSAVKQLLYTKIYECVHEKPALHESILELLYEHVNKYLPEEGENTTLMLDKCVQTNAMTAVLIEPISRLLYVIAQFIPMDDVDPENVTEIQPEETRSVYLRSKLNSIMEQLCNSDNFCQIDMEDPALTDLTPESKAKCLKVQQILQCYEVLIAHQVMQWNPESSNVAGIVYRLYKAWSQLLDNAKAPAKVNKKAKSSLNETKETVKSQKSQKSQKDKGKGAAKSSNMVKDRVGPFKPLPCVWDLKFCLRILDLLYEQEVPWSSNQERDNIRSRRNFHHWCLRNIRSVIVDEYHDKRAVTKYVISIATILYSRCISRFETMCEFDELTALGCLEVFKDCLSLLFSTTYGLKTDALLSTITNHTDEAPSLCIAAILEHIHKTLDGLDAESVPEDRDLFVKKLTTTLIQTAVVVLEIPVTSCTVYENAILKLEQYVRTSKQDCLSLIPVLLSVSCREQQEAQFLDDLLHKLTTALGKIDEEDTSIQEDSTNFPTIDSRSGHTVLNYICIHLGARFKCAEHLVSRARDLTAAVGCVAHNNQHRVDKELKELYKSIVIQLCQVTIWTSSVGKLRCCVGGGSDRVLGTILRLYALLATLTKQIDPAMAQLVRLERLLKLSGKQLSTVTDNLITYLEASQQQQNANKVLRETKLIPRLVLHAEQFSKHVILLANKAKLNYQQYLSLGTARDFRIKAPILQEVLQAREQRADGDKNNDDVDIDDASTTIITPVNSDNEEDNSDGSEENTSRRKRRRLS